MLTLDNKIDQINKVGPTYLKKLQRLKIKTVRDLFFHFPHRYDDFSQIVLISQLKEGQVATIQGEILETKNTRIFPRRMTLTESLVKDQTGTIKSIWFNQHYLAETLKKGKIVNLSGKLVFRKKVLCFSNPAYEIINKSETTHTGRLIPIYHETAGLTSRYLRYIIKPLLFLTDQEKDFLPQQIKKEFELIDLSQALKQIHFPDNLLSAKKARERLAFNELFLVQLSTLKQKKQLEKEKSTLIPFNQGLIKSFVEKLPFKLTNDQRIAAWEIFQDIGKPNPMNRLLDGDVGSGKTIVALMAALAVAKQRYQTALMAPTEILAKQHFETFKKFLKGQKLKIILLTGSTKKPDRAKFKNAQIIIGTHALIQKNVNFKNLALAIIDEQHRFGVAQRAALQKQIYQLEDGLPTIPHLLSMTATPIPRTLTLTIYGDLDISLIKEMPKGRKKIITKIILPNQRKKTYDFIRKQVEQKKQTFVICPLIDDSEKLEVKSVTQEYEKLKENIFPDLKISMLHGKLKPKEKEEIMDDFKKRRSDILVSTSVVEVGVDIPNATVMMIEGADRFGLAQLHQFRGRIGRGDDQSYCFLLTDSPAKKTSQRLEALINCQDGFELAEKDLQIRGPGDFTGLRQSGLPNLAMASLSDLELIKKSRKAAQMVLEKNLLTPQIEKELNNLEKIIHLE
ncbi:MAG: ATP-dependent DNA helicase RecG [Candidatus Portnoybacteria bacterium]